MYLVSSCLAGMDCKYNGGNNANKEIIELVNSGKAVPVCPEQLGGLTTPRIPCEIIKGRVMSKNGEDRTGAFELGATRCLDVAKALKIDKAILKAKSPSCGCGQIYDGTFTGTLVEGNGITAKKLMQHGISVTVK